MSKSDHERVIEAIEDRFYENGLLANAGDIVDRIGLSRSKVDGVLEDLEGNAVFKIYEGNGVPTIYLTKQMKNSLVSQVGEPEWIEEYEFEEKRQLRDEVKDANDTISQYQQLERLLYAGGTPLEDSVELALEELGFSPSSTYHNEDLLIEWEGITYVIEIKGVSGKIKKKHVNQLGGWLDKKVEEGMKADELSGVLLHNTQRNTPPRDRGDPLTSHAGQYLQIRSCTNVSTTEIYELIKKNDFYNDDGNNISIKIESAQEEFMELIQ